jgi:hypothetical protein
MPEDITKLKINFAKMETKMDHLSDAVSRIEKKLDSYIRIDEERTIQYQRDLESRFAAKWVEKAIVSGAGIILIWVLYNIVLS